jgi:hypothetical protein
MERTFSNYWKRNFVLGMRRSWEWMGVGGKILDIIIAVTAGFVLGQENIWTIGLITVLVAFAIYGLVSLFFALFIVPFQESRIQDVQIEKHSKEIRHLKKQVRELKDKLEIKEVEANVKIEEFLQDEYEEPHLSLKIINHETVDLLRCYGTLISLKRVYSDENSELDNSELKDSINPNNMFLSWGTGSSDGYVTIHKGHGVRILNIAKAVKGHLVFLFQEWESKTDIDGLYHVIIKVDGNFGDLSKSFKSIIYDGYFEVEILLIPPSVLLQRPLAHPGVNLKFVKNMRQT